ncbi:unnamed protein product [Cuscuta epithymum]|uniref:SNF1-related protein kinase regulatory subunit gamma-like PV42a n=1 Tax=Cuscuta epithymum TaxID=186058 RepID=A0AAV0CT64_9ASTE|nr:unnamed protein product [Cuscuta epithymum]
MQSTGESCEGAADSKRQLLLIEKKVADLIMPHDKRRRLVEVPYTATLADTMNTLLAHRVAAVPVAAPPGQWIGAGGTMILEHDKSTGAARKHYIGMVTMLDVLAHIAGGEEDLDLKMAAQVSSIIGHCLESLSLWTLNPAMSLVDCMEVFSKGIHRAMVPLESLQQSERLAGVELVESASSYGMVTQMDVLKFLREYNGQHPEGELKHIMSCRIKVEDAAAVFGISDESTVMNAIKCMKAASLTALPILHSSIAIQEHHSQLFNVIKVDCQLRRRK